MNVSPERIGPYRILKRIGRGGVGEVFAAVHEHMGQQVALKVLLPEHASDPDTAARFIREARALAQFGNHPGIVQVHHFDRPEGGVAYLAMELLQGKTLRAWFREQKGPLPLDSALTICRQVAEVMSDVHQKAFVHRDLKPENIMMVPDENLALCFRPKILDFGIVKAPEPAGVDDRADTQIKTSGINVLGTHAYMAPEQFKNADNVTEKADVYALGIVLHELLAGKPPFESDEAVELILMHGRDIPKRLDEVVESVPPNLASFVASMLAKAPEDRPSMRDCRDMLTRDWALEDFACPFPGLLPFKDFQAHLFFGRRMETLAIRAKLDEIHEGTSRRWLQIQGPSGTGKSSLVHAAILPALVTSKQWRVVTMRPGEDPIRNMAAAFAMAYEQNEEDVIAAFRENADALNAFVKKHASGETKVLLVIDQFEELFALGGVHRPAFEALIAKTFATIESPLCFLTTIRSDYLHRFDQALGLARLLDERALRYDLRPMDEPALAEVIDGMAGRAGLRLSEGLPRKMVQDATGTDCRLPLLGHTLRSLWSLRSGGAITHEHYEQTGGVGGALAKHAEQLVNGLGDDGKQRAKWLVLDLVRVGRGAPDTRRPRIRAELIEAAGGDKLAEDVLMRLSGVGTSGSETEPFRLVVISGNALDPNRQSVDLVHEMVLQKVPVVVGWINEERELLERLVTLEGAANAWADARRPKDGLPFGSLLDHYRGGKKTAQCERLERMASVEAREFLGEAIRQQRRRMWALRGFGAAMLAAVVAIVVSAVVAQQQRQATERVSLAFQKINEDIVEDVDWELGWRPNTADIRKTMLEELDDKLVSLERDDALAIRVSLIKTMQRRSDFARTHDTLEASYERLIEAKRRIDIGIGDGPKNVEFRKLLALHHSKHGKLLLAEKKWPGARTDFIESIDILESLVKQFSLDSSFRSMLATSYLERGNAELLCDHASDVMPWYDKAIVLRRDAAKSDGEAYLQALVADALILQARALLAGGQSEGAREALRDALRIQEPVVTNEPHNMFYQLIWAKIYIGLAAVDRDEKQWGEAAQLFEKSREVGVRMLAGDKDHKEYALLLIEALAGLEAVGDKARVEEWRTRRCEVAVGFVQKDPRDKRFDATGCK